MATNHPLKESLLPTAPTSIKAAINNSKWFASMKAEFDALTNQGTWTLVPHTPNMHFIGNKCIFFVKLNFDVTFDKFKSWLVAKGYLQEPGIDFQETFTVVKPATVRTVLTLSLSSQWIVQQLHVSNAFLNGALKEVVYMMQPR